MIPAAGANLNNTVVLSRLRRSLPVRPSPSAPRCRPAANPLPRQAFPLRAWIGPAV